MIHGRPPSEAHHRATADATVMLSVIALLLLAAALVQLAVAALAD